MRKTDSFKIGSLFQGRKIIRRLDSGRKPFREVYLCSSAKATEQVLILYKNSLIPDCMIELGTMCPIEYYRRIHLHGDDAKGLPELFDYGQNDIYTWLFEESILHMPTLFGILSNIFNLTPSVKRCVQDFAKKILTHTIASTPLMNIDSPKILLPGNIRWWESKETGLSTAITSLDELFSPEYYDTEEAICPYYDIGNEAQIPDYHEIFDVYYSSRGLINNRAICS